MSNPHHTDFRGAPLQVGDTIAVSLRDLAQLAEYTIVSLTEQGFHAELAKAPVGSRVLSNIGRKRRLLRSNQVIFVSRAAQ